MSYIPRQAEARLARLARSFPVVTLTGPRQSGKTTLARKFFAKHKYVSLENPDNLAFARGDGQRFLENFRNGVIIDEAQRCPQLFSYLQDVVDQRQRAGEFVITGSEQFSLSEQISQSLAGRSGALQLLPLALGELQAAGLAPTSVDQHLLMGGYPAMYQRQLEPDIWFPNYIRDYLERDVRQLSNIRNLSSFQIFLKLCAARCAQQLNTSSLANECGVSHTTIKNWLSVLESSYVITLLRPYHRNYGKRMAKMPKLYFLDIGLAAWLLGLRDINTVSTHIHRPALFENLIMLEFFKANFNAGRSAELFYWRDSNGIEVDLIFERQGMVQAVEIKSGSSYSPDWRRSLRKWQNLAQEQLTPWLIYGGEHSYSQDGIELCSWRDLPAKLQAEEATAVKNI